MSDEDEYLSEETYEFEFEDDDVDGSEVNDSQGDYGLENRYYYAKGLKDNPEDAIVVFKEIVTSEKENAAEISWIFKSYKQLAKLYFAQHKHEYTLNYLRLALELIPDLNLSYAEESVNKMLSNYSSASDITFVSGLHGIIFDLLSDTNNEISQNNRLWLKMSINRLYLLLDSNELDECSNLIDQINERLQTVSEITKNAYTLELIAAEIQYHSQTSSSDISKLNHLYKKTTTISSAVTHPKIMGIIKDCGAKVQFYKGNYEKARLEFYESFKSFDEAGSPHKKRILKYLALCSLLAENEVNPFESQETQTYARFEEYSKVLEIIKYYDELNLDEYMKVVERMRGENDPLASDDIFKCAHTAIIQNMRSKLVIKYLKAYRRIKFDFLTRRLHVDDDELKKIIIKLVSDGKVSNINLDFISKFIEVDDKSTTNLLPNSNSKQIYENIKCLDLIFGRLDMVGKMYQRTNDDDNGGMDVDSRPLTEDHKREGDFSFFSKDRHNSKNLMFSKFFLYNDGPTKETDWLDIISSWYRYVTSAIPSPVKVELSQKDQVFQEQRAGNDLTDSGPLAIGESNEAFASKSSAPATSAIASFSTADQAEEEELEYTLHQSLKSWIDELTHEFNSNLTTAYR